MRRSLDNDKQAHSLDMQKDSCLELAKKHGWLIDEIFDEGQSSARKTAIEDRPVITRLLKDADNGLIGRVLVYKRDRLARNVPQYLQILKQLRKNEVEVHFAAGNEPPLFSGSTGDFLEAVLAGISQQEGDNIVHRIKSSLVPLARKGKWVAGTQPYGYKRIKLSKEKMKEENQKNLEFDETKVKVIHALFSTFLMEDPNWLLEQDFRIIHQKLKKEPLLESIPIRKMWKMLNQPLYNGLMVQTIGDLKVEVETPHYRIISQKQWDQVQAIIKRMKIKPYFIKDDEEEEYPKKIAPLLKGLLYCGQCEAEMDANNKTYCCKTESCKSRPNMEKVHQEVSQKVYNNLLKKAGDDRDWELLKNTIMKFMIEPAEKKADKMKGKIANLKVRIKYVFQQNILHDNLDTQIQLKDLIQQYVEVTDSWGQATKQLIGMKEFFEGLPKKKVLALAKELKLSNQQREQLFSLVQKVIYYKKSCDVYYYLEESTIL
ncbi:MAG: recombinase family protein [Bacillaceae bacterium]